MGYVHLKAAAGFPEKKNKLQQEFQGDEAKPQIH